MGNCNSENKRKQKANSEKILPISKSTEDLTDKMSKEKNKEEANSPSEHNLKNKVNNDLAQDNHHDGSSKASNKIQSSEIMQLNRDINRSVTDLINLKKKIPFYPHVYKIVKEEDISFYAQLSQLKSKSFDIDKIVEHLMSPECSIDSLSREISQQGKTDLEYLLVVFYVFMRIITDSIIKKVGTINEALKSYSTVYRHDTEELFEKLLKIKKFSGVKKIEGFSKNPINFKRGNKYTKVFWFRVNIDEKPHLIDPFFHVHNDLDVDYAFCPLPQIFVYTHFTMLSNDLLLDNVSSMVNLETFETLPIFPINFFKLGLHLIKFQSDEIDFYEIYNLKCKSEAYRNELEITFGSLKDARLDVKLVDMSTKKAYPDLILYNKKMISDEAQQKQIGKINCEQVFSTDKTLDYSNYIIHEIKLRIPQQGNFEFNIEAKNDNSLINETFGGDFNFKSCFKYYIKAVSSNFNKIKSYETKNIKFPEVTQTFLDKNCALLEPNFFSLSDIPSKNQEITFSLVVYSAEKIVMKVDDGAKVIEMSKPNEGFWSASLLKSDVKENVKIYAKFEKEEEDVLLVSFSK